MWYPETLVQGQWRSACIILCERKRIDVKNYWLSALFFHPFPFVSLHVWSPSLELFPVPDSYLDVSLTAFDPNLTPRLAVDSSVQCRLAHIKETGAPFCSLTNTICRLICAECRINWAFEEGDIHCFLPSFPHFFTCFSLPLVPPPLGSAVQLSSGRHLVRI